MRSSLAHLVREREKSNRGAMSSVDLFGFCELQFDCELAKSSRRSEGRKKGVETLDHGRMG